MEKYKSTNEFIASFQNESNNYLKSLTLTKKKSEGIYYTDLSLSHYLMNELIESLSDVNITNLKILEPCIGMGSFVFSFLTICIDKYSKSDLIKIINNIYVADIDNIALTNYFNWLNIFCYSFLGITLDDQYFNKHCKNGLLYSFDGTNVIYKSITSMFGIEFKDGFDIVFSNPPYKNMKAEKNKYSNTNDYEMDKTFYSLVSKDVKTRFSYADSGVLNIYKLFVEDIVKNYSSSNGFVSLLIPSTMLTDISCSKLRNLCFEQNRLISVNTLSEQNGYFEGTQALCSLLIKKGESTSSYRICSSFSPNRDNAYINVDYKTSQELLNDNSIVDVSPEDTLFLKEISKFPKLKSLQFIQNLRGELDLTSNSDYITTQKTTLHLLRGRDLGLYNLKDSNEDYVDDSFLRSSNKATYIKKCRIACQQISNMNKDRRLVFSFIPKNHVLGNSCNFISCEDNLYGIDIYYLLGILNSSICNRYFKFFSSNNHVSNYELNELPIVIGSLTQIEELSNMVKSCIKNGLNEKLVLTIDNYVSSLFNLNTEDNFIKKRTYNDPFSKELLHDLSYYYDKSVLTMRTINALMMCQIKKEDINRLLTLPEDGFLSNCIVKTIEKYQKLSKFRLLNHTSFKLSDLDMEMIRCVPPGGSWKNISPEVVKKSKRLVRITQTGGRTTLYGRIDYSKPSYTITTYFNRPGNGTYIHPSHDRVISVREAARLQSFDDSFFFTGNKTDMLNQIGNAVPPIFAKNICSKIMSVVPVHKSIDLFVGAGGLTSGFEKAGVHSVIGIDIDKSACTTLKVNIPSMKVVCGDITDNNLKDDICRYALKHNVDIVCGGPPCQGFSMAGKRFIDDPRNQLFKDYIYIVHKIKPKILVFENVDGIKSMQGGKVYEEILLSISNEGYKVHGKLLMANEYGVPQKRKRMIIIGARNDLNIDPEDLYPVPSQSVITTKEAIFDLDKIECSDEAMYKSDYASDYIKSLRKTIDN